MWGFLGARMTSLKIRNTKLTIGFFVFWGFFLVEPLDYGKRILIIPLLLN